MYLQANLTIRYGQTAAFAERFVPIKARLEAKGWRMLGAYTAIIGEFTQILHLWQVESPDTVTNALFAVMGEEGAAAEFATLGEVIESERTQVVLPMPYSPLEDLK